MRFLIEAHVTHESFDAPIHHKIGSEAKDLNQLLEGINLPAKNICDLRLYGKTAYYDINQVHHELSITEDQA